MLDKEPTSQQTLPVRPIPISGESLRGYRLRLSSANGYSSPAWLNELDPKLRRISDETSLAAALAGLSGHSSVGQLTAIACSARFKVRQPRICPECIKEHGYHSAVWDLVFACACPLHGIRLIDICPKCNTSLSWNRPGVDQCNCGSSLTDVTISEADQNIVYLNAMLWNAAGRKVEAINSDLPDKDLSGLSLGQICQLYWFLAAYGDGQLRLNRNKPVSVVAAEHELKVVELMLADWPSGFYRMLEGYRGKDGNFVGEGLQQAFGKIYRDLYGVVVRDKITFVKDAFEDYIRHNWTGIIDGKYRRMTSDKASNDSICINGVSKLLGIGVSRLKKLMEHGLIKGNIFTRASGSQHIIIPKNEVKRITEEIQYMKNRSEARAILGVSEKQFQIMINTDLIKPVVYLGSCGLTQWWFDVRAIEKFLDDYAAISPQRLPDARAIPFTKVCQQYLGSAKNFSAFLNAILKGTVPINGIKIVNRLTLASLYFLPESIFQFRKNLSQKMDSIYSIPEAAECLGVKQEVAYHLVRQGHLQCETYSDQTGRKISEANLQSFLTQYIGLKQIASLQQRSVRSMQNELRAKGVIPICGPGVDGCRQVFYRKNDVTLPE